MRKTIFFWIVGAVLVPASAANAQAGPPANPGGVRPQDVAAQNRQVDSDYNTLAGRGVDVNNADRKGAAKHRSPVPATAEDIKAGAPVRDVKGVPIGTIASLSSNEIMADPTQPVIDTGQAKIGVPLNAFGKDDKGLLLSITAEKFNQLVAQVHSTAQASEPQPK
jgi:hypothetical protein